MNDFDDADLEAIDADRPLSRREMVEWNMGVEKYLSTLISISASLPLTLKDAYETMPSNGHSFESTMNNREERQKLFERFASLRSEMAALILMDLTESAEFCHEHEQTTQGEIEAEREKFWAEYKAANPEPVKRRPYETPEAARARVRDDANSLI